MTAIYSLGLPESKVFKYGWAVLADIATFSALLPGAPEAQLKLIFSLNGNGDFQYMIQIILSYIIMILYIDKHVKIPI